MDDRRDTGKSEIEEVQRRLQFWRERLQIASSSCRSGALRERAAVEIESLEQIIDALEGRSGVRRR